MPCPHFEPLSPLGWGNWRAPLRPPLGVLYDGVCHAGAEPFRPGPEALADNCNMGYAAGRCPRFRPGSGDAVRFAMVSGASGMPAVRWLVEAGSLPVLAGEAPCSALDGAASGCGAPANVVSQLRAYVASYRAARADRRGAASA